MKQIYKTFVTKSVGYQATPKTPQDWTPSRINEELYSIFSRTSSIGERHYPLIKAGEKIDEGRFCLFVNSYSKIANDALFFTVCAYVAGHVPESFMPDFSKNEAELKTIDIKDEHGNKGEVVHSYRCLAFGQIIIMEAVQGSGMAGGLQKLLRSLCKRYSAIPSQYPALELNNIILPTLKDLIEAAGGVRSIRASLVGSQDDGSADFSSTLSDIISKVEGTQKCVVEWSAESGDSLNSDTAIDIINESQSDFLTGVSLKLNNNVTVNDLSEYNEKRVEKIPILPNGRPSSPAIDHFMKTYLGELCAGGEKGSINQNGTLKKVKKLEVSNGRKP